MTAINYYRWSLLLPILVPALAIPSALKGDLIAVPLVLFSVYGGAPYVVWAIYALLWLRGKSEAEARQLSFIAPLQVAPLTLPISGLVGVWAVSFGGSVPPSSGSLLGGFLLGALSGLWSGTPLTILFGYLWVGYINETLKWLKRWGWVWSAPEIAAAD